MSTSAAGRHILLRGVGTTGACRRTVAQLIDPDAPEFVAPGDLPGRIQEFCRRTGQPIPETVGAVMRCIYESLALKYRYA